MYFNELVSAYDRQRRERNIYHDLMRFRVREVLLVGSLYDSFVVESDGILTEQIYGEYFKLNLNTIPRVTCAYTEESSMDLFRSGSFDLVILMAGIDFDLPLRLANAMKQLWPDIPILLMATNNSSLEKLDMDSPSLAAIDRVFVWNGYSKLFVGMIKYVEDLQKRAGGYPSWAGAGDSSHRRFGEILFTVSPGPIQGRAQTNPDLDRRRKGYRNLQASFHTSQAKDSSCLELRGGPGNL